MQKYILTYLLLMFTITLFAQKSIVPIEVDEFRNSNAVIRKHTKEVKISSTSSMSVKEYKLVTVLNSKGDDNAFCYAHYDEDIKLIDAEVLIYDSSGQLIKKVKEKDLIDESAVSGSTLYSDSRVKYLDYKPTSYPYTVAFTKEYKTNNTAFIPSHKFLPNYDVHVQESTYKILYNKEDLEINFKEKNFDDFEVNRNDIADGLIYSIKNIAPIPNEYLNLPFHKVAPEILAVPFNFNLSGFKAENINNWQSLGKWFNEELLSERTKLPEETITQIKALTKNAKDPLERAKIVYDFVQKSTRYISVQVGIGGYQPIEASEVDEVKYGDCKGLSNYTKALLDAVGVTSYYTHVEAGYTKVDFEEDFASLAQGNHAILSIPYEEELYWIDCTSQTNPFGFLGTFTDDRKVLIMKPSGGEIVKTPKYLEVNNYQKTIAKVKFTPAGEVEISGEMITKGTQYDSREVIKRYSPEDLQKRDYQFWSSIDNLNVVEHRMENNRDSIYFQENFILKGNNYTNISSDRLFIPLNVVNANSHVPQRYRSRKTPFYISRGYVDEDEITIKLPEGYVVESLPKAISLVTEFGEYQMKVELKGDELNVTKHILIKEGTYSKDKYSAYRTFRKSIADAETKAISLIQKT